MGRDIQRFVRPDLAQEFERLCRTELNLEIGFSSVDRDYKEQTAYFAQGREELAVVNALRSAANLPPITDEENRRRVTWTMKSNHIVNLDDERSDNDVSYAFDFFVLKDGKAVWSVKADVNNDNKSDYLQCAMIGERLGLKSGRHFKNPDFPHLEYPRGGG